MIALSTARIRLLWRVLLVIVTLVGLPVPVQANNGVHITAWYDPSGMATVSDVRAPSVEWSLLEDSRFNEGVSSGAQWLHITLPPAAHRSPVWLRLDNPLLTEITVFRGQDDTPLLTTGRAYPAATRAAQTPQWLLPLPSAKLDDTTYLVRIRSDISLRSSVSHHDAAGLAVKQTTGTLGLAAYYGIGIIMCAFYGLVFGQTRERVYLWFSLGLLAYLLSQLEMDGMLALHVYPNYPQASLSILVVCLVGIIYCAFRFAMDFLELSLNQPVIARTMTVLGYGGLLLMVITPLAPGMVAIWLTIPYLMVGNGVCVVAGVRAMLNKQRSGTYYMLATTSVSVGSVLYVMLIMGLFQGNLLLDMLLKLANVFQALLLGYALIDRYRQTLDERNHYQQVMVDSLFEANRIKDEFLNIISHELRTPLNGIQGAIDMMRSLPMNEALSQNLGIAESSFRDMLRMVDSILDWTEINNQSMEVKEGVFALPVDVRKLMESYRRDDQGARHIVIEIAPDLASHYLGDSRKIFKILRHLMDNAVKFGGHNPVLVSVTRVEQQTDKDIVEIVIDDQGAGIDTEKLAYLFEPFTQGESGLRRKFQGMGLGLPISRGLALLIGGDVTLEPGPLGGARARLRLPLSPAPAPVAVPAPATPDVAFDHQQLQMLVVEDNLVNQKVLTAILSKAVGGIVSVANDGQEALDQCRERHFDFIWMDCQMPVMDGLEATRLIRRLGGYENTPIVAVTANALAEDEKRCIEAGMNDFLAKPVNRGAVERMLRKWAVPAKA